MTVEPLRWLESPSRVIYDLEGDRSRAWFQVTAPNDCSSMCAGRPAEELPRILSIFSPAHHLASAMALDRLFGVRPPEAAQNMRKALLQAQILRHHAKKLFFLVSSCVDLFSNPRGPRRRREHSQVPSHVLGDTIHLASLAQEAGTILGGRFDHPVTAVPGGMSRLPKEGQMDRLVEISESCLKDALRVSEFMRGGFLAESGLLDGLFEVSIPPMAGLALDEEGETVLNEGSGRSIERFSLEKVFETFGLHYEPWTYRPFVYLKEKGWKGLDSSAENELSFVGPLARLNFNKASKTDKAEEERQRLINKLGPFPHLSVPAAFWALLIELIQSAESLGKLCNRDGLAGSEFRVIPSSVGRKTFFAMEAPEGLIFHHYEVDERGIVKDVQVVDSETQNNALRCLLTRSVVADCVAGKKTFDETKKMLEICLMAF